MKTTRVALALLLALAPTTFPTVALAQTGQDDPMTAMARARFKEGVDFYDKGEYDQARASFLQAYALKKHPAVLLNLAWSCVKSGHALEGKKYFEQFLAESKDITDKQRADANDGLKQAQGKLGRIEIQAIAGTDVTIDGDHIGTAPLSDAAVVEAGAHTIKFKGPDGSSDTQSVSVLGGQKAVAHFPQTGSSATPVAAATPPPANNAASPPADNSAPSPSPAPSNDTTPAAAPAHEAPSSGGHAGFFTPPDNVIPAVILAGVGVVGIGTGIIMGVSKSTAQSNANDLGNKINANGGPAANPAAYNAYNSDLNDVNTDATIANIGLGVGIVALVGAVVYWGLASKESSGSAYLQPVVAPTIGRSSGGLSVSGAF
jgi:hypothetical protein